ncbi:unnamed protein product [Rhodiola kirilowii]
MGAQIPVIDFSLEDPKLGPKVRKASEVHVCASFCATTHMQGRVEKED